MTVYFADLICLMVLTASLFFILDVEIATSSLTGYITSCHICHEVVLLSGVILLVSWQGIYSGNKFQQK